MGLAKGTGLFSNMLIGFAHHRAVFDDAEQPCDFFFTDVNEAFEKMTGLNRRDIIGKSVTEVSSLIQDSEFDWIGTFGRVVINGEKIQFEQYSELLGRWYSVTAYSPEWGTVVAFFADITDYKLIEVKIQHQRELLEHVIESLTHPFYVIDANSYMIGMANSASGFLSLTDSSTCYALTHGLDTPCVGSCHPCPLERVKETKKPVVVEHLHSDEYGTSRLLEVHGYPIFNNEGNVTHMIEYSLDITEHRRAKKQMRKTTKRAMSYLNLMSHDVSTQLQIIVYCNEILREELISSNLTYLNDLTDEAVQKCQRIIARVRSTAKIGAAPLIERSLDSVLFNCIETLLETYDQVLVETVNNTENALVMADESLEHLLYNLLENAVVDNPDLEKCVWVKLLQSGNFYEISIANNGSGIEDLINGTMFDPVHRFGRVGLHQVYEIVEKYSGRIEVHDRVTNSPKSGVEFIMLLPIIEKRRRVTGRNEYQVFESEKGGN